MEKSRGFTLIELIVAILVVAILTAIAVPGYRDHVRRGKITEATAGLADMRVKLEQYFQDNRTYVGACVAGTVAALPTNPRYFTFACPTLTATTYTVTATGIPAQGMNGFLYQVTELNAQTSTMTADAASAGFVTNGACWITRKGAGPAAC